MINLEPWRWENIVTLICAVALVLGLFAMSNSWHSLWGLVILMNMNYLRLRK